MSWTIDASPDDGVLGPSRWTDIYKPTIAAVNGVAYAGGLEWACWTDMAIADEHATFGVTCRRWNIGTGRRWHPTPYAHPRLPPRDRADRHRAGDRRSRSRTHRPRQPGRAEGTCLQRAIELAETIAALPQPALRTDLEAARNGQGRPLDDGLQIEADCFNRSIFAARNLRGPTSIQRTRPPRPSRRHRRGHAGAGPLALADRRVQPLQLASGVALDQQRDEVAQRPALESGMHVTNDVRHGGLRNRRIPTVQTHD